MYRERKEEEREKYKEKTKDIAKDLFVYVDETGINEFLYREKARSQKGESVTGEISGRKYQRVSIVDAYCNGKLLAPMVFYGTCNTSLFNHWVEKLLIPKLKPGQIVVMDNASIHKGKELKKIIENAGCSLLYLPPYSPDFNPIEHFGANLKKQLRSMMNEFTSGHIKGMLPLLKSNAFQIESTI